MMNPKDRALQGLTPVVMVPKFEPLEPLEKIGHRFLLAASGLWLEAKRDWCHVVWPVALQSGFVAIPCGELSPSVNLAFGTFPVWILEQFTEQAVRHQPVETGAVAVWNSVQKTLRYAECESVEAGIGHLRARWPTLGADESIAIDMHSHGPISAYFSSVDRKDMGSDVVVACVVGKTDQQTPQVVVSLFVCGLELRVPVPGHKQPGQNDEPSFQSLCEGIF